MPMKIPFLVLALAATAAQAAPALRTPQAGVLCDRYFCADQQGVSGELTRKYLGAEAAASLAAQGDFDRSAFTYANGVFCDTRERVCREDRYFGPDGKRSGAVDPVHTRLLFPR
ncbi:hypothetical protein CBR68_12715 [Bordetella hinzii]|nr:YcgJ family protein [Bordetella hinzii]QDJ33112.1 hypothetical protein CBR68_12715 [Bordetella hinzii]